ncbi:hypothetical protein [Streptomyces chartreusis]|uniref:Uncharacterized protein n=1 Tax=Streptomyces chartreusis TaxID=1969 RepID=A0A7H8T5N3_STRCX|nr:hypothetical protein [Streptomyces chartreusis]QKZ18811.1 hypothetical protein HUT05_16440 [Streptomyces chartreusis]
MTMSEEGLLVRDGYAVGPLAEPAERRAGGLLGDVLDRATALSDADLFDQVHLAPPEAVGVDPFRYIGYTPAGRANRTAEHRIHRNDAEFGPAEAGGRRDADVRRSDPVPSVWTLLPRPAGQFPVAVEM